MSDNKGTEKLNIKIYFDLIYTDICSDWSYILGNYEAPKWNSKHFYSTIINILYLQHIQQGLLRKRL